MSIVIELAWWLLPATAVLAGWRVFATRSMVRSALLLLLSFVAVAAMMLLLLAPYLGIATIFMMTVEMMVMAVFMVMFMMNPAGLNPMAMVHQQRFAVLAGVGTFGALAGVVLLTDFAQQPVGVEQAVIHDLGVELLGNSMLVFESAGVALLATMIGVVALASRSGRYGAADIGSLPPPLHPGGQPAGAQPDDRGSAGHSHHGRGDDQPPAEATQQALFDGADADRGTVPALATPAVGQRRAAGSVQPLAVDLPPPEQAAFGFADPAAEPADDPARDPDGERESR